MPKLKDHPKLVYRGHRMAWPPNSGWGQAGSSRMLIDEHEIARAILMEATWQPPPQGHEEPGLRLRVKVSRGDRVDEFSTTLHLDDYEFLHTLHRSLEPCFGTVSLGECGEMVEIP